MTFPRRLLSRWPHLPAFFPGRDLAPWGTRGAVHALPAGWRAPRGAATLRFTPHPFPPPRFAGRSAPALLTVEGPGEPLGPGEAGALAALIREHRLGGPPDLADPGLGGPGSGEAGGDDRGLRALGLLGPGPGESGGGGSGQRDRVGGLRGGDGPGAGDRGPGRRDSGRGESGLGDAGLFAPERGVAAGQDAVAGSAGGSPPAVLVLDPCDPAGAAAARAALAEALAGGGAVRVARDPWAAAGAAPVIGAEGPALSPWSLLDGALALRGASPLMAALAEAAGVPHDRAGAHLAPLLARLRAADPFRRRPASRAEGLALLAGWRALERANRGVAAVLGVARWKRRHVSAALGHGGGAPAFARDEAAALSAARARGGSVAVWAPRCDDARAERLRAAGAGPLWLEDGFVRSRGLGARFLPGASYTLDPLGPYYDPRAPSALERRLSEGGFPPALLARAAALRRTIVEGGVTKYNLPGAAPPPEVPAGRRAVLVPGQVEDDASVRLGGGAVRGNLDLLRAARAAEPDGWILYRPHPDLEAGYRRGRLRAGDLAGLADAVAPAGASLPALLSRVEAVHALTSLAGFEALLRGVRVVTWGRPFYAGWGLTEDRDPLPPGRRGVSRSLDELVAAALLLHPRYLDPVTLLPCPAEVVLERLVEPGAWRLSPWTLHRAAEGWVRRVLSRLAGRR